MNENELNEAVFAWIKSHEDGEILRVKDAFIAGVEWMKKYVIEHLGTINIPK